MSSKPILTVNRHNRRVLLLLAGVHLLWALSVYGLFLLVRPLHPATSTWSLLLLTGQLLLGAQLLLPLTRLQPEDRGRGFYLFWGTVLLGTIWLANRLLFPAPWGVPAAALKSALLLFSGSIVGAALARYVRKLWEILPLCLAMSLADFFSWMFGPTANFAADIERYYLKPEGPPPLIDMVLVKLAVPGTSSLAPVFGLSDWIMVSFFVIVACRHSIRDNLLGPAVEVLIDKKQPGLYLPVPAAALILAVVLAQSSGLFIPVLPFIALCMLLWLAVRHWKLKR